MGKPERKYRFDRRLGWGREVHTSQPLASTNGWETLSLCRARLWLVLLHTGQ